MVVLINFKLLENILKLSKCLRVIECNGTTAVDFPNEGQLCVDVYMLKNLRKSLRNFFLLILNGYFKFLRDLEGL